MSENASLYAILEARFRAAGPAVAFSLPNGTTVSYAQLADDVARMANALAALGVKPGDRVMAQVEKSLANVHLYLATLKVGAVFNPLNTAYTAAELEYFIGDAQPALIAIASERHARIEPI